MEIGTPLFEGAKKLMLLGSGELGKEIAVEAQRMGIEVIAVDRYDNAPAMHVSHRRYVIDMMNRGSVLAVIRRERPDVVVPEVEAINTEALLDVEEMGITVTPNANAVRIAMNRVELRRVAAEKVGVPTTRYYFAENAEEVRRACKEIGLPCLIKPEMSSSGHGHVLVKEMDEVGEAYKESLSHARGTSRRVVVEEYVKVDTELTILTYRHRRGESAETKTMPPVEHRRPAYHYVESWQPATVEEQVLTKAREYAMRVVDFLGGFGVFGVEIMVSGDRILFNEVAPRPHDTGMVTMVTQDVNEFQAHVRCGLGLQVPQVQLLTPGAARVVLADKEYWAPKFGNLDKALSIPGVQVRVFGKPYAYEGRRMAIVLANGKNVEEALNRVREASSLIYLR